MLIQKEGYDELIIKISNSEQDGEIIEIGGLYIMLPPVPEKSKILNYNLPKDKQMWKRQELPHELERIKSMDEWRAMPREFRSKWELYIDEEFTRREDGVWFYNNGVPTYITGRHYMALQWSKFDVGYPSYLDFQRKIFLHMEACIVDDRSLGQLYTKCRRSGYTNCCSTVLVNDGTRVVNKLLGIQSKTGKDAQENIFMKKIVPMYKGYPFFFKPIQDGTTNPRMELAFREPSKKITKSNKTSVENDALNTVINWKNTTNNAYDGEKLYWLYLDEAGKWEKPVDIREAWRIQKTCLIVGKKIVGKALVGSTVNPMDKGGKEYKALIDDSDPLNRNANGRTASGLYKLFIPAYEALEGFFDVYGNAIVEDPTSPVMTLDGTTVSYGAKTYLKNERKSLEHDARELNEFIRQFPFSEDEAVRESVDGSHFDVGRIYQQIEHNNSFYPSPVVSGDFVWKGGVMDTEVLFVPKENGKWRVSWLPPMEYRNKKVMGKSGKISPPNGGIGRGGVDSYDIDQTVDTRSSKGSCHLFNVMNSVGPCNHFVAEYVDRPPMAKMFYEQVLMASFFFGYPLLVENNKYGIVRYFEERGYDEYIMDRPAHLKAPGSGNVRTKGVPSNSQDIIQTHAQAIEDYIFNHVGDLGANEFGHMYFNRTLEDWIGYRISDRTKFDLTISSGFALLAAQTQKKEEKKATFEDKQFFRYYGNSGNLSVQRKYT
jgi:hypothetical protein